MFAPFSRITPSRPEPAAFVREVQVEHPREPRSRRSELVLGLGWVLIVVKCLGLHWLCRAYAVPVNPWWVIAPTLLFAGVCTGLYLRRH